MRVLTFGELLLRLAVRENYRLFQNGNLEASFGGAEANVAVALSQFGIETALLTVLPDNDVGRAAFNELRYFGVDISNVRFRPGRMGIYFLEKGISQRPSRVIYDREYSVFSLSSTDDFDWNMILDDVSWFHWTGITAALSDNMPDIIENACSIAREKGITISCDLNYRKKLWSKKKAQLVMKRLMPYVDICVGNEEDAETVLGIKPKNSDVNKGILDKSAYESVAKQVSDQYGCKKVAFTLRESYSASRNGWSGILYSAGDGLAYCSNKYDIDILDRVGGGDGFTAGLIYGIISEMTDQDAVEFAVASGCLAQTIDGDYNRCSISEVEELYRSGGSGRVQR